MFMWAVGAQCDVYISGVKLNGVVSFVHVPDELVAKDRVVHTSTSLQLVIA